MPLSKENKKCSKCGGLMSPPKDLMDIMTRDGFGHLYVGRCSKCSHTEKILTGIKKKDLD